MKKTGLLILIVGMFFCGFAMADPGVPPVNEVQGLSIETTVIAVGHFDQESDVYISSSSGQSLGDMPPLGPSSAMYESVYNEDTHSSGIGYIGYDKSFVASTAGKTKGQYNVESTRQISFVGIDAGSIYSAESLSTGGSGTSGSGSSAICPFGADTTTSAFCNRVETGSTFNMKVANVATQANNRFITRSADAGVETNYHIQVSDYIEGMPSQGSVSAYIKGTLKEGGRSQFGEDPDALAGEGAFEDKTELIGEISIFDKLMHYDSSTWV
jgi:hypothetical protein